MVVNDRCTYVENLNKLFGYFYQITELPSSYLLFSAIMHFFYPKQYNQKQKNHAQMQYLLPENMHLSVIFLALVMKKIDDNI
jgi:hypothetical protein